MEKIKIEKMSTVVWWDSITIYPFKKYSIIYFKTFNSVSPFLHCTLWITILKK